MPPVPPAFEPLVALFNQELVRYTPAEILYASLLSAVLIAWCFPNVWSISAALLGANELVHILLKYANEPLAFDITNGRHLTDLAWATSLSIFSFSMLRRAL